MKMHHYPRYGEVENLGPFMKELDSLYIQDKDIF
jgi:hypothetical protein